MQSIIMHLDMNSYFASVEQQDNLAWRGKPVGVCEHLGGILIAASVEAKKWGIKTGTPVWEARKLYPKIIVTPTRPDRYRFFNRRMVKVVSDYTSAVEVYSIDEVFADLTKACNVRDFSVSLRVQPKQSVKEKDCRVGRLKPRPPRNDTMVDPFEEAVKIAREIKQRFKTEVGDWLRCSIGIAENKLLAKIGSDMQKPDGLVVIVGAGLARPQSGDRAAKASPYNIDCQILSKQQLYNRLSLIDIPGIGRRQEKNLNELGIRTLKELRDFSKSHLVSRFGNIMGHHLYNIGQLQGTWKESVHQEREINPHTKASQTALSGLNYSKNSKIFKTELNLGVGVKSMGHMYTLPKEFRKPEFFMPVLYKLCEMVGRRLRRKNLMGDVIYFYAHDDDYQGFGKSIKLGYFLQDGRQIFLETADLHADLLRGSKRGSGQIKLIGITVAGLRPYVNQLSLFGDAERERRLTKALDKINDKYGEFTILRAQMLPAGKAFKDSIGFGRVKELG